MRKRTFLHGISLALSAMFVGPLAQAEPNAWPERPVRIVVAYPAGGGVDFVARLLAQRLGTAWGQAVTVENKSGASGTIGADYVAKSRPDGLTLLLASPAEVLVGPIAGQKTPYDARQAFKPISLAGETPLAIVTNPALGIKDLGMLSTVAKQRSLKLSLGTPGSGSSMQFAGEALNQTLGLGMGHVPYRGAAPAVNDVLGNQIPLAIVGLPPLVGHVTSGKLQVLAVTTDARSAALPDVPAVSEFPGLAGYRFSNWMLLLAPAGTAQSISDKIANDVATILKDPEIRRRLEVGGVTPMGLQGAPLARFLADERVRYENVAKKSHIQLDF
ncbi:Bug family tripartite tricarboxylate transporter substrate binding protein [Diaphorobacter caeni]|uniref:Bug family tripartite tricarboxylate transporter substrate binding protein n=1 Tax=Diaphorobacter caeni TaxID=2784387 RepID=UPI00188FCFE7|nr:tripartite tricarboxylate transporter substrate-binding protein [Diaphorobacter caeni]MBF5007325.1 tripartite tricarboxylate transporter substrate binding protein [Diaphorobacter caeni]